MVSEIVSQSLNAAQLFALIAIILFIVAAVFAVMVKSIHSTLICAGLAFLSLGILFYT
jgi:hypothetical protein